MSSSAEAEHRVARAAPASQPVFPDEILEEIFLRLDAAADVARASAACATFRRVVSVRRFRSRFRSLHPPPILGVLELESHATGAFHPAEPPHGSAPAARALAQAADFTFSFIDAPGCWRARDSRDGRNFDPFLDPATDDDEDESFRVICVVQCRLKLVTFHFSSVTGEWRVVTFDRRKPLNDLMLICPRMFVRYYAHGCFYWICPSPESSFILNPREMKFSVFDHPRSYKVQAIVELGSGRLGLVNLCCDNFVDYTLELHSKTSRNNGVNTEVWQHDKTIPFPKMEMNCLWNILDAAEG
ncbi:hypothetical protein U9M48_037431 [Paspalum notatum var. saurae]|uniref:F-box domain-containing protein n=1 Tax=Paspalum notatum var. saurae TaxID=547442 RepID=A0AAQ3UGE8_PASNO